MVSMLRCGGLKDNCVHKLFCFEYPDQHGENMLREMKKYTLPSLNHYCSRVLEQRNKVPKEFEWSSLVTWTTPRFTVKLWRSWEKTNLSADCEIRTKITAIMCLWFLAACLEKSIALKSTPSRCVFCPKSVCSRVCVCVGGWSQLKYLHRHPLADRGTAKVEQDWLAGEHAVTQNQDRATGEIGTCQHCFTCTQNACQWKCSKEKQKKETNSD